MRELFGLLSPWGRTTRYHYRLIILASALVLFAVWMSKDVVTRAALVALIVATETVDLIATVRRLHDARWSRWWLVLYLFPMSIDWDLLQVQAGASTWHLLDVSAAIRLIPVIIGLLASSQPTPREAASTFA